MTVILHPLARKELLEMPLPRPVAQYRPGVTERLYTNPFAQDFREYPCPLPYPLYQEYAELLNLENLRKLPAGNHIPLTADNMMFTAGSIMGIDLVIRSFCEPGKDSICITTPTFNGDMQYARVNLVGVIDVPLMGENFDEIDVEKMTTSSAKVIFLCVPSNPIGTCLNQQSIIKVLDQAKGIVVIDEAYIDLADMPSSTTLLNKYPNLIVLRTFSKGWGLAGIRAGALVASPSIIAVLSRIQDPFSISTPVQKVLKKAFANIGEYEKGIINIKASREKIKNKLLSSTYVEKVYPSYTNFVLAKVNSSSKILDAIHHSQCLLDQGPREIPNSIKVSIGTEEEQDQLFNFLDRFKEIEC